jgi:hypothetical protein
MRGPSSCTGSARDRADSLGMDILAIVICVVVFAVLYASIELVDRV